MRKEPFCFGFDTEKIIRLGAARPNVSDPDSVRDNIFTDAPRSTTQGRQVFRDSIAPACIFHSELPTDLTHSLCQDLWIRSEIVDDVQPRLAQVEQGNRLTYQGAGGYADVHLDEYLAVIAERLGQLQHAVEGMRAYTREAVDRKNRAA